MRKRRSNWKKVIDMTGRQQKVLKDYSAKTGHLLRPAEDDEGSAGENEEKL